MVILILKLYFVVVVIIMLCYMVRHAALTITRLYTRQKISYRDIYDSDLPSISVLIPMYNEEAVARNVLDALLECDYAGGQLEIIPINDNSSDGTEDILDEYAARYPFIHPLHRSDSALRGKPAGLNDAMEVATGEVIVVFDADYIPSKNLLRKLANAFYDPQVGAVMGRVVPINVRANRLTRLLNVERSGGYQVDQQARYDLNLMPQYGGTVGGYRKDVLLDLGGFNTRVLAEDTELTYKLFINGWHVAYDNTAECYEESPETWKARGKQVRRWSRGHNAVMHRYLGKLLVTSHLDFIQKVDGFMLLVIYLVPFLFALSFIDSVILFFLGEMNIFGAWWVIFLLGAYNSWGNFAPFFEIATGNLLDGMKNEMLVLPLMCFTFYFNLWYVSWGYIDSLIDLVTQRRVGWNATKHGVGTHDEVPT